VKKVVFDFDLHNASVDFGEIKQIYERLKPKIKKVKDVLGTGYETDCASINLPFDKNIVSEVNQLIAEKRKFDPAFLIVIGIGGSNLGTIAIHKAINGILYNDKNPALKVYFVDSVDTDYVNGILELVERKLKSGKNILVNVVTKSGTTTETVANFEIFLGLLKKYKKEKYNDYIVAITDKGSKLWDFAKENDISSLAVPKKVGGRYSVFSAVGLFPLGFIGLDIEGLQEGAKDSVDNCTSEDVSINYAALSASIVYYHYTRSINIHDTFIFSKSVYSFGQWYRQLVGESLGKKYNKKGEVVNVGITPTVSLGTTDLHSVAQLYLGGPYDKFTTFVTVKPKKDVYVPKIDAFEQFVENIQSKSVSFIMNSIIGGVREAYKKDKRPFVVVDIPEISAYSMGQLLQWKMLEVMYLGYLLGVNPFDQPQVELYKKETREILAHE